MLRTLQTDISSVIAARVASAITSIVAGGAGDNTAISGLSIDRLSLGMPGSARLSVHFTATVANAATLSILALKVQDSADGATWTDYKIFTAPGVVATGGGAGPITSGTHVALVLTSARRFIRVVLTPDLSAANTDTAIVCPVLVFGGFDRLPAP